MICLRTALRLGILTPLVAQDVILTIFWKDEWLRACIGCILKLEHLGKTTRNQKDDYLVSFNEPLNSSLSENYVRIGNKCLLAVFFKVWVKWGLLWAIFSSAGIFSCLDCFGKFWLEIIPVTPDIVLGLKMDNVSECFTWLKFTHKMVSLNMATESCWLSHNCLHGTFRSRIGNEIE